MFSDIRPTALTFCEDTNNLTYNITENFKEQIQMVPECHTYELISYDEPGEDFSNPPQMENTYRIKLSYDVENFDIGHPDTKPVTVGSQRTAVV